MASVPASAILRHVQRLALTHARMSDGQLLQRFAESGEEAAFAALLQRHGRLVWSVCWNVLHHEHDVEDAFQATFLVLARQASAIRKRESVASWLHGVAFRIARKAKQMRAKRAEREHRAAAPEARLPPADLAVRELQALLDEELHRLPEKYRAPFVVCCLEGRSRKEAAKELGWNEGTLSFRIAQARRLLQQRLSRRGVTLSAALTAGVLWNQPAPAALVRPIARAASRIAAGRSASDVVAPSVAALANGLGRAEIAARLKLAALIVTLAAAVGYSLALVGEPAQEDVKPAATRPNTDGRQPVADAQRDPLPQGAITRLGSGRLRTGRHHLFLPDGRRFVGSREDGAMQISDVTTGKPLAVLRGTDIPDRKLIIVSTAAASPDGKYLAAVCWEGRCGIWETATGRLVRWLESGRFYSIVQCDFSPDGKYLAVGSGKPGGAVDGSTVGVYEVESGRQLFSTPGTNSVFAPEGQSMVTWNGYGGEQTARQVAVPTGKVLATFRYSERFPDSAPRSDGLWFFEVTGNGAVRVLDAATGAVKHTFRGPEGGEDEVVYVRHVPGRRELIAVATKQPGVWCWDLNTGKELWQVRLTSKSYFPELSRDGKILVLAEIAGTVRVLDAATGKERTSFKPAAVGHVARIKVSPDGKTVATSSGGSFTMAIAFWDAATGKLLTDLPGHSSGITAVALAPDGAKVYTVGKDRTLRAWDSATGQELVRSPAEPASFIAVSSDNKTIFAAGPDAGAIRVLDARTGKRERTIQAFAKVLVGLALTSDGKRLIAAGRDQETGNSLVRVLDASTGAKLREFGASAAKVEQLAMRPDGETIATTHVGQQVVVWGAGGKKVLEQVGRGQRVSAWERGGAAEGTPYRIGSVGISADGRWLAYSDQEQGIVIVSVASGREVGRVKLDVFHQSHSIRDDVRDVLAFSPDDQMIAWSGVESTADIFLIEVRTAKLRDRLPGDSSPVQHLVFAPDCSRLLSAGPDGSALIWALTGSHGRKTARSKVLSPAEIESCWTELESDDAAKAYQAMRKLTASPAETVGVLSKRLQPIAAPEVKPLSGLILDLDSDTFATREAATRELTKLEALAEPALRKALDAGASTEARRRIEELLAKLETFGSTGSSLRAFRAIELLEQVASPEARHLLEKLATGAPDAWMTRHAKAALERLAKHAAAHP